MKKRYNLETDIYLLKYRDKSLDRGTCEMWERSEFGIRKSISYAKCKLFEELLELWEPISVEDNISIKPVVKYPLENFLFLRYRLGKYNLWIPAPYHKFL